MLRSFVLALFSCFLAAAEGLFDEVTQGTLRVVDAQGKIVECPLRHTDY